MNQQKFPLIALCVDAKIVTYFDNFGIEHIPKEI